MLSNRLDRLTGSPRRSHFAVLGTLLSMCLCCGFCATFSRQGNPTAATNRQLATPAAIAQVEATVTEEPQPTASRRATNTEPAPSETARPTNTPLPTETSAPTDTQLPPSATNSPQPAETNTPQPTLVPATIAPVVVVPTNTAVPVVPTNTPVPIPPTDVPPPPAGGDVRIAFVLADGGVPSVESDEYAVIRSYSAGPTDMGGWVLNAGDPGQNFSFPGGFILQSGQECRVYTNEFHPESCGFSFGNGSALWNNGGDCGFLYRQDGSEASRYCY